MKNAGRWDMWAKKATLTSDCTHPCCLVKGAWSYVCAMKDNVTEENRAGFGNDLSGIKKKKRNHRLHDLESVSKSLCLLFLFCKMGTVTVNSCSRHMVRT
jgi:hypothetical protein